MKIIKYFFVGGTAAVVDITIFFIFAKVIQFPYLTVGALGFVIATIVNYILSTRFVFISGSRFSKYREIILVYAASIIGLLLNQLILYACVDGVGLELMISKLTATGSVFLWNFFARNNFIFKPTNADYV